MKQTTMNSKESKNSVDTVSGNSTSSDGSVDVSRKAPTNGSAKVIDEHRTVTVFNKPVGKQSNLSDDDFDEEDFYDPLSFLDEREDSDQFPLTMTITRHRDLGGNLLQKEDQEYMGRFEVNRDRWRDDVKQKVSPGGGRFLVVFRWDTIGPEGQNRGSIAAKYPFFCAPTTTAPLSGQTPAAGPVVSPEEMEMRILAKMKMYKDLFSGGSGGGNLNETITLLNNLGLIKKPDEGAHKGLAEQISEIKEVVSLIGGGGTTGWDVLRDLSNSEVAAAIVDGVAEIGKAYALKNTTTHTEPAEKPKHDAESEALPEHELAEAIDAEPPLQTQERTEMPAEQAKLYNAMIERAIQDLMTNSPVDSTSMLCEQYFTKYPVDSMELIKEFIAGDEAALQFLARHTTDAELQKNLLALPTGKDWIKRLREKLIPV